MTVFFADPARSGRVGSNKGGFGFGRFFLKIFPRLSDFVSLPFAAFIKSSKVKAVIISKIHLAEISLFFGL